MLEKYSEIRALEAEGKRIHNWQPTHCHGKYKSEKHGSDVPTRTKRFCTQTLVAGHAVMWFSFLFYYRELLRKHTQTNKPEKNVENDWKRIASALIKSILFRCGEICFSADASPSGPVLLSLHALPYARVRATQRWEKPLWRMISTGTTLPSSVHSSEPQSAIKSFPYRFWWAEKGEKAKKSFLRVKNINIAGNLEFSPHEKACCMCEQDEGKFMAFHRIPRFMVAKIDRLRTTRKSTIAYHWFSFRFCCKTFFFSTFPQSHVGELCDFDRGLIFLAA